MQHASAASKSTCFMIGSSLFYLATIHKLTRLNYQPSFIARHVKHSNAAAEKFTTVQKQNHSLQSAAKAQKKVTGTTLNQLVPQKSSHK